MHRMSSNVNSIDRFSSLSGTARRAGACGHAGGKGLYLENREECLRFTGKETNSRSFRKQLRS